MFGYLLRRYSGLLAVLLLVSSAPSLWAATYYVSLGGNNTNTGAILSPFRNINYGISKLAAGDTLKIKPGTYYEIVDLAPLQNVPNVTIRAYTPRTVVIDGRGSEGSALGSAVPVTGLQLIGLIVTNCDEGLCLADARNVSILNCEVRSTYRGLWIKSGSNVKICMCYVHDNVHGYLMGFGGAGIAGLEIINSIAADNCYAGREGNTDGFGIESSCSQVFLSRCTAYGHGDSGFDIKSGYAKLTHCTAYNNVQAGFKLWRSGVKLINSLSHHNDFFGIVAAGNNLRFWNLTIANNGGYGLQLESSNPQTVSVRNCIFFLNTLWVKKDMMYDDDYNLYCHYGTEWVLYVGYHREWRFNEMKSGLAPLGSHSIVGNPYFVNHSANDYHLRDCSNCIGKGVFTDNSILYDLEANRRKLPMDIGAYDYIPAPS